MLPLPSRVEHLSPVDGRVEGELEEGELLCHLLRLVSEEVQLGGSLGASRLWVGTVEHEL